MDNANGTIRTATTDGGTTFSLYTCLQGSITGYVDGDELHCDIISVDWDAEQATLHCDGNCGRETLTLHFDDLLGRNLCAACDWHADHGR